MDCCTGFFSQQHLLSLMILLLISLVSSLEKPLWLSCLQRKPGRVLLEHPLPPSSLHLWWAQFQFAIDGTKLLGFFWQGVCHLSLNMTHLVMLYIPLIISLLNGCNSLNKLSKSLLRITICSNYVFAWVFIHQ